MRRYGLLLHISSLPSVWGIGDLGPAAHAFARTLAEAGGTVWQFLPLNPTSAFIGNSPYSSPSAFAGNPLFISPELLAQDGWLSYADLDSSFFCLPGGCIAVTPARVDYDRVTIHRDYILCAAFERNSHKLGSHEEFQTFIHDHDYWLHDYARFVTLKKAHGGCSWADWPREYRERNPTALADWDCRSAMYMLQEKFIQYLFFSQWQRLRETCKKAGVFLLADVPIYVTHDSADVWANPQYFHLDASMQPITVSGVPPDYFSAIGQRWGTPVYRWDVLARDGFSWWKKRLGHTLLLADITRLDHFRGFCGYWEIPVEEETAIFGVWRRAPARELLLSLREHFYGLPFLAEDLGVITHDVHETMEEFALPGMHVLQFAFSGDDCASNPGIPHGQTSNSFVYTGTHDNAPTRSWFQGISAQERGNLSDYTGLSISLESATPVLARLAFSCVADYAILPMQDALNLGEEGRMNVPGVAAGNWTWRMTQEQACPSHLAWLRELARIYGRLPKQSEDEAVSCPEALQYSDAVYE